MRTKFTTDDQGRVTVCYDAPITGYAITRTFWCPPDGGYVQEDDGRGGTTQPCRRLACSGDTLICKNRESLPDLIRREYRAMIRAEKKEGLR